MKLKTLFIGLLITALFGCKSSVVEPEANNASCHFPDRIGFVNDYCHFLTAGEIKNLEQTIADLNARTGTEIIIIIEDSKKSHSKKFHTPCAISKKWHLDKPENCNDIVIAISGKRTYVDISYGEKIKERFTPEDHRNILNNDIVPAFKKKQYYEGLRLAVDYIVSHQKA